VLEVITHERTIFTLTFPPYHFDWLWNLVQTYDLYPLLHTVFNTIISAMFSDCQRGGMRRPTTFIFMLGEMNVVAPFVS